MKTKRTSRGVTELLIHNPAGPPPTWPGERTRNMARSKKKGGKKRPTARNSASVKQSRPAANKTTRNTAAKPKTYRKGGKRNSASRSWIPNPFGALKSIDLSTAAGVGIGVLGGKATDIVMSAQEWSGIAVQGALALFIAYAFGKSKLASGAALGLAGIALYNATNKLSNNAIENAVLGTVQRFRPVAPQPQLAANNGAGMSGLVGVPAGWARYSG